MSEKQAREFKWKHKDGTPGDEAMSIPISPLELQSDLQAWAEQEVAAYRERQLRAKVESLQRDVDSILIRKARRVGRLEGAAWVLLPLLLVAVAWAVTR